MGSRYFQFESFRPAELIMIYY